MSNDAETEQRGIFGTWFGPIGRDNAAAEIRHISGVLMTLGLVQLVFALFGYLLPQLPFAWSDLPWQHLVYGPVLFALGLAFGLFNSRIAWLAIAGVLVAALLYESYDYVTVHMDMISADLNTYGLVIAGVWRALLMILALRALYAALIARG